MEEPIEYVSIKNYNKWIDEKLNHKYYQPLRGLNLKFYAFFAFIRSILEILISIKELIPTGKQMGYENDLVDNQIILIKHLIQEFPLCLDLGYCKQFIENINEKIGMIQRNLHPLIHIEINDKKKQSQIISLAKKIENSMDLLDPILLQIKQIVQQQCQLLNLIHSEKTMFFSPLREIMEEWKKIKQCKAFQEYQQIYVSFTSNIKQNKQQNKEEKGVFVKQMIGLIKDSCYLQVQLEQILDTPIKLVNLMKMKNKQFFQDIHINQQALLFKYINLLGKPGFIQTSLSKVNLNELISMIRLLEKQKGLLHELKKFSHDQEELQPINEHRLRELASKWEQCNSAIEEIQSTEYYKEEFINHMQELSISFKDLSSFTEKLWEFQKSLMQYHRIIQMTSKLQTQVQKYFFKEYNIRVELVFNDLGIQKYAI